MREGIKIYFRDFAFKTTTLQDFINCLKQSLQKQRRGDVDLQAWVDSWLTKAGANEITPKVEEAVMADGTRTFSVHLLQSYPRNGDKVYHEQIIDVTTYDDEGREISY